jgi:hypothetical protein
MLWHDAVKQEQPYFTGMICKSRRSADKGSAIKTIRRHPSRYARAHVRDARRGFQRAVEPKQLQWIEGASHNDLYDK